MWFLVHIYILFIPLTYCYSLLLNTFLCCGPEESSDDEWMEFLGMENEYDSGPS
jgi:hypothetical protein